MREMFIGRGTPKMCNKDRRVMQLSLTGLIMWQKVNFIVRNTQNY